MRTPLVTNGLLRVVRDGVFVDGDMDLVQPVLQLACRSDAMAAEVGQHQVVVRAAGDEVEARAASDRRPAPAAFLTTFCGVDLEFRLHGFLQADGLGGDDVHQRAALRAGEDGAVELLGQLLVGRGS